MAFPTDEKNEFPSPYGVNEFLTTEIFGYIPQWALEKFPSPYGVNEFLTRIFEETHTREEFIRFRPLTG